MVTEVNALAKASVAWAGGWVGAIAISTKLDKKARTADALFNRAQQFDKAVHSRQFRNRLY
ncbi:MAG: hypothetical protein WCD18_06790, partial [Thermosynechococcaceae cyanobacterium]